MSTQAEPVSSEPLDETQLAHMKRLRRILQFLARDERLAHMEGRVTVFGSAAAGKQVPGDIDAYFDFSDSAVSVQHPDYIKGASLLLGVASQFYGLFDPFVRVGKILYSRDDEARGWVRARNVGNIRKAGENGRPPSDVYDELRSRPYEFGGAPKPAEPAPEEPSPSPGM